MRAPKTRSTPVAKPQTPSEHPPSYDALAERAARSLTEHYLRRGRRIQKLAGGAAAFEEARRLADQIADLFGLQAASDIFENVAHLCRSRMQKAPGKRKGAHDSDRDLLLLAIFDEDDPNSLISLAREGKLPKGSGQFYEPMNKAQFAKMHVGERWGAASGDQILRRLKHLRSHRTK